MNPSFIYFDLDNTLLHHSKAEAAAHKAVYEQFPELQSVQLDQWIEEYKKVNLRLWEWYQQDKIDRFHVQHARFFETMHNLELPAEKSAIIGEQYMKHYSNFWEWVDGAQNALISLSAKYSTGIITNGFSDTQMKKFQRLSIAQHCKCLVISEEIGKMKPHPSVFEYAQNLAEVPAESILYVGDSYSSDIIGANRAGWKTAWFTSLTEKNGNEMLADFEFTDFQELIDWVD